MKPRKLQLRSRKSDIISIATMICFLLCIGCATVKDRQKSNGRTMENQYSNDTFYVTQKMPEFPGGWEAMHKYLREKVKEYDKEGGVIPSIRVIVQFVVGKDGSITCPQIVKSQGKPYDEYAMEIVKSMPNWIPGELKKGVKAYVWVALLITFYTY